MVRFYSLTGGSEAVKLARMAGRVFLIMFVFAAAMPAFAQQQIDWESALRDAARVSEENIAWPVNRSRDAIDEVRLPVLLPAGDPRVTASGRGPGVLFFPRGDSYVASFEIGGASVELIGAGRARFSVTGADVPEITRTDAGLDANFSRYGAGYTVSVACSDSSQPECSDPDFAREIIAMLRMAGGSPG